MCTDFMKNMYLEIESNQWEMARLVSTSKSEALTLSLRPVLRQSVFPLPFPLLSNNTSSCCCTRKWCPSHRSGNTSCQTPSPSAIERLLIWLTILAVGISMMCSNRRSYSKLCLLHFRCPTHWRCTSIDSHAIRPVFWRNSAQKEVNVINRATHKIFCFMYLSGKICWPKEYKCRHKQYLD